MKKHIIFLFFSLFAAVAFAQGGGVKESSRIRKDSAGRIYRERTIVVPEFLPDTSIIKFQIGQIDIEMDTLKARRKRLVQEIKDWKKGKDGPPGTAPNSAPRSEENTPIPPVG